MLQISKLTSISDLRFFGNHLYCVNNGLVFRFDIGKCFHGYCAVQLNYTATMIALMSSGSVFTLDKEEGMFLILINRRVERLLCDKRCVLLLPFCRTLHKVRVGVALLAVDIAHRCGKERLL